jgi:hypothetical protein
VKELIRLIRSFGSLRKALVCILPLWQKPENDFRTPTYVVIGGSDISHTRQGGINKLIMQMAMVLRLLGTTIKHINRENKRHIPLLTGISINEKINLFSTITVFSTPIALSKS